MAASGSGDTRKKMNQLIEGMLSSKYEILCASGRTSLAGCGSPFMPLAKHSTALRVWWFSATLVGRKPGILRPAFVGMRGQWSYDYSMQRSWVHPSDTTIGRGRGDVHQIMPDSIGRYSKAPHSNRTFSHTTSHRFYHSPDASN